MVKRQVIVRVLAVLLLPIIAFGLFANTAFTSNNQTTFEFRNTMRKLWEDHITWTRLFIVSNIAGLPDEAATTQRLLQNQDDIGDAVRPFYGDAAADQLTALLREHILGAAELLEAVKANDPARIEAARTAWYRNGDEIAAFLHEANPRHWDRHHMEEMMRQHLDLTLTEAAAHLQEDYDADIAAYDGIHDHILGMADELSSGIIRQFPNAFAPGHQH